jgi:cellulose biosynthesis protein BcsQ
MISISREMGSISQQASPFQGLIYGVFQRPELLAQSGGFVVALVAAHPLAGTTYLTTLLTQGLNSDECISAASFNCREMANSNSAIIDSLREASYPPETAEPASALSVPRGDWRGSRDYRASYLAQLRSRFSYVLIDCPSLKESTDVLGLTTLVDGVLLVVEANKTTRSQIAHLERTIEGAEGKILGHVLNKRTYPIPDFLHRQMTRWGF